MLLVTSFLPAPLQARVAEAVTAVGAELRPVSSWLELELAIQISPVSLAVVDPYMFETTHVSPVARLINNNRSTPVIAYTDFAPWTARALAQLSLHGMQEVVVAGFDDTPERLRRLVMQAGMRRTLDRFRAELSGAFAKLAPDMAQALDTVIERPHTYTSALDMMDSAGVPKANAHRMLRNAGLSTPKHLFVAARVLHAYIYLRHRGNFVADIRAQLGYHSTWVLSQHVRSVLGVRPFELRRMRNEDEVIGRLLEWVRKPDDESVVRRITC